ncbi:hypothetical protein SMICM304S_01179 [Streptomyces microflavus]
MVFEGDFVSVNIAQTEAKIGTEPRSSRSRRSGRTRPW